MNQSRRDFIKNSSVAMAILPFQRLFEQFNISYKVGIQLFSIPKMLSDDFAGGIEMLAKLGYKEIEMFGPYPFSDEQAKENWKAVTPSLGFSGSGYFGKTIQEVKSIFDNNGLKTTSMHTDLDTLKNGMYKLAEAAHILGQKYVTLPAIPPEYRKTIDDYKRMADLFNIIGENAKNNGIRFAYHNHGYGFKELEGQIPFEILIDRTDDDKVFLEMDIFWTACAGVNPVDLLNKYKKQYKMLHLKDMKESKTFSGDGGDFKQWIAMFPLMTSVGLGVLDIQDIIATSIKNGIEHYFVEQDLVQDPSKALGISYDNLSPLLN